MSRITDVIISAQSMDRSLMEPFLDWDDDREWYGKFGYMGGEEADQFWSNGKGSPLYMWVGSFNHLNRPALLEDLQRLPWSDPHSVQVFIREEEDACFGVWMLFDGDLREVPLPGTQRRTYAAGRLTILERTDRPRSNPQPPATAQTEAGVLGSDT